MSSGSHHDRADRRRGRHQHRQRHVAVRDEGGHVGGLAAGAARDQDEADGERVGQGERLCDHEAQQRLDEVLRGVADQDGRWALGALLEVVDGQSQPHSQHEEAQGVGEERGGEPCHCLRPHDAQSGADEHPQREQRGKAVCKLFDGGRFGWSALQVGTGCRDVARARHIAYAFTRRPINYTDVFGARTTFVLLVGGERTACEAKMSGQCPLGTCALWPFSLDRSHCARREETENCTNEQCSDETKRCAMLRLHTSTCPLPTGTRVGSTQRQRVVVSIFVCAQGFLAKRPDAQQHRHAEHRDAERVGVMRKAPGIYLATLVCTHAQLPILPLCSYGGGVACHF